MPKESTIIDIYKQVQMNKSNSAIYSQLNRRCIDLRDDFEKQLTDGQKKQLQQFLSAREARDEQEVQEYFIEAFKIAVKLMNEVFYDGENN